ncbi:MAG: hypothetical protein K6T65_10215 [Peptococcaceae bacterium]|nr:hypothetical protein [Peptococcaceae bacterium]
MVERAWRNLAAAVIVQAALDCIQPRKIRDDKRSAKTIKREATIFFKRAAAKDGYERLWFDVLGVRPEALLEVLKQKNRKRSSLTRQIER